MGKLSSNFNISAILYSIIILQNVLLSLCNDQCEREECHTSSTSQMKEAVRLKWEKYLKQIDEALDKYKPCEQTSNSTCFLHVIKNDLSPFKAGITKDQMSAAAEKGTKYQIIDGKVYRQDECMFPSRCSGIEHFLLKIARKVPDMEMIINTRDWPQVSKHFSTEPLPVFSFSKTGDYHDIMYPTWSFWAGGPAIKLYPRGLGRWDEHRSKLEKASNKWPWNEKKSRGFFRGSRTSAERDPLVLLSRENPDLVDAQYTKNQAWKSDADTLNASPASEVSLEDHCQYKFLFNFRGVAASFRFKHLFLCGSLVLHVGDQWLEFFYPAMKPWVHYIPLPASAPQALIREALEFALENDDVVHEMAKRGRHFITDHLRMKDIEAYWLRLLKRYAKLLKYEVTRDPSLNLVTPPRAEL